MTENSGGGTENSSGWTLQAVLEGENGSVETLLAGNRTENAGVWSEKACAEIGKPCVLTGSVCARTGWTSEGTGWASVGMGCSCEETGYTGFVAGKDGIGKLNACIWTGGVWPGIWSEGAGK